MDEASVRHCYPGQLRRPLTLLDLWQFLTLKRDHLSALPRETLAIIFELVYELNKDKQMLGAISRSFLPYTRQNQLRKIRITSWRQLELLVDAGNAELGEFIEDLSIVLGPSLASPSPDVEALSPSDAQLVPFLRALTRLRNLEVARYTRLAEILLSPNVPDLFLPSLESLDLHASFHRWPDPFNPAHYNRLGALSSLKVFTLMVARDPNSIHEEEKGDIVEGPSRFGDEPSSAGPSEAATSAELDLTSLVVGGALGHPLASQILDLAPSVVTLDLISEYPATTLAPFFQRLRHPELLGYLAIYNDLGDFGDLAPVDDLLLPLVELDHLLLTAGTFGPSMFTHVLPLLPLTGLQFGLWASASTSQIIGLLEGPSRISTLETLTLDMVEAGKRGTRIREEAGGALCPSTVEGAYDDWERAEWLPELPREGAEQIAQAAKRAGVTVEGDMMDALQVEIEYDTEIEYARSLREAEREVEV